MAESNRRRRWPWIAVAVAVVLVVVAVVGTEGATLVGVDTPSIDPANSTDLPAHQAVRRHDLNILEGVVLSHVEPGLYELIALPLRLAAFDGSPVRAVLRGLGDRQVGRGRDPGT